MEKNKTQASDAKSLKQQIREQERQLREQEQRIRGLEEHQKTLISTLTARGPASGDPLLSSLVGSRPGPGSSKPGTGRSGVREPTLGKQIREVFEEACQRAVARAEAWSSGRTPDEVMKLEEEIAQHMREAGDRVTSAVLQAMVGDKEWESSVVAALKGTALRNVGRKDVEVSLLGGGSTTLNVPYLGKKRGKRRGRKRGRGKRGKAGSGLYPTLVMLGVLGHCTPALASDVARQVVSSSSYDEARADLARRGIVMDEKTVRRIVLAVGTEAVENRERAVAQALEGKLQVGEWRGKRIVVAVDGGRLRVRVPKKRGRIPKGKKRRRFKAEWREPKVMVAYVIDEDGKRERSYPVVLDGTLENADAVFRLMVGHLKLMGADEAKELIVVGDGARWIWNRIDDLVRAVGIEPRLVTAVVDFYHAVEHLQAVVNLCKGWSKQQGKRWLTKHRKLLRLGKVEQVTAAIQKLCKGRRSKKMKTELNYFETNKERMRYKRFESRGIPMGSGAVESAVRRVVNLRMKGNSIYWLEDNGESFLHLRCAYKAGRWTERIVDVICGRLSQALAVASPDAVLKQPSRSPVSRSAPGASRKAA
jgi:hypothetical protein